MGRLRESEPPLGLVAGWFVINLESVAHKWYWEKALLILIGQLVGAAVIALLENVLVVAHILEIQGKFQGAPLVLFAVGHPQIHAEIGGLALRISQLFIILGLTSSPGSG